MTRIQRLALFKGFNKHKLSLLAGVSYPATRSVWKTGVVDGTKAETLRKIAEALDCEPWHLYETAPYPDWYKPPKP